MTIFAKISAQQPYLFLTARNGDAYTHVKAGRAEYAPLAYHASHALHARWAGGRLFKHQQKQLNVKVTSQAPCEGTEAQRMLHSTLMTPTHSMGPALVLLFEQKIKATGCEVTAQTSAQRSEVLMYM